jgi:hypothetical protein
MLSLYLQQEAVKFFDWTTAWQMAPAEASCTTAIMVPRTKPAIAGSPLGPAPGIAA